MTTDYFYRSSEKLNRLLKIQESGNVQFENCEGNVGSFLSLFNDHLRDLEQYYIV